MWVEVWLRSFVSLALDGGEWSVSCFSHFTHLKGPRYPVTLKVNFWIIFVFMKHNMKTADSWEHVTSLCCVCNHSLEQVMVMAVKNSVVPILCKHKDMCKCHCNVCSDETHISKFKINKFSWIKLLSPCPLVKWSLCSTGHSSMCMLCCVYVVPCIDIPVFHVLKLSLILVFFIFINAACTNWK
jgi:hypothetical protein